MRIGVVGCGDWGRNIARNLFELGVLDTICDSRVPAREFAQSRYPGVKVTAEWEEMLADEAVGAVAVATNAASHHAIARAALEAGKDVFVEKPMAVAVPDAKELVSLARKHKRILMVGHLLLYSSAVKELKELMGDLGEILYVHAQRMGFDNPRTDVNVLWDLAVHEVSVLLYLLRRGPKKIKAYGHDFSSNGVKDFASIKMVFPGRITAHVDVTWWYPHKVRRFVVVGAKAMAVWDDMQGEFKIELHDKWIDQGLQAHTGRTVQTSVPSSEPLRAELQHFLDCCRERKVPLTDGRHGLEVTEILASAERSLYRQEWQVV